jgi:hypothetical protein
MLSIRRKCSRTLTALLLLSATIQPLRAVETFTDRLRISDNLYLRFKCIIVEKSNEGFSELLKDLGIPLSGLAGKLLNAAFKATGLHKGSSYCWIEKWRDESGGPPARRVNIFMTQKPYANGAPVTVLGGFRRAPNSSCRFAGCVQAIHPEDADKVDAVTTCIEVQRPTKSIVVGVGNFKNLVDSDQTVMDKPCAERKY